MNYRNLARMWTAAIVTIVMGLQEIPDAGADEITLKAVTASTLTLTSSAPVVALPARVTLTARVGGTALKGSVTFRSGATDVGAAAISNNVATTTITLPAAIHSLTAVFVGSAGTVASAPIRVVVDNALACG